MSEGTLVRAIGQVRQAVALLRAAGMDIDEAPPAEASELAGLFGEAERVAAVGALRCAQRVGRGSVGLLATVSGTASGAARRKIETAEVFELVPVAEKAFRRGELSSDQAQVIAPVLSAAPEEAAHLLERARAGTSLRELKNEATRILRARRSEDDEQAREARVHRRRYCQIWTTRSGGVRLDALLGTADGALVKACLEKEADALYEESHRAGVKESQEHLLADALVGLLTRSAKSKGAHVVVRVDAGALQRGEVHADETCEIEGVGTVSVETAKRLMGDGFFTVLVKSGVDITTVTSTKRTVKKRLDVALRERDKTCVVPGCAASRGLERHHWRTTYFSRGPTEIDNMCRLCHPHHKMVTDEGWKILGGPGKWRFYPPKPRPPGPDVRSVRASGVPPPST